MSCANGRVRLKADDDRRLFAESASTCLLCNQLLFSPTEGTSRSISIAERAHIVGHSADGPRGLPAGQAVDRDGIDNIVLLCPTCHTKADKAPNEYPVDHLLTLKAERSSAVLMVGGAPVLANRESARAAVQRILRGSRTAFLLYGPEPRDGSTNSAESSAKWSKVVLDVVVPSHQRLIALVRRNSHLATEMELVTVEKLQMHADDLKAKHEGSPLLGPATRFPGEIDELFKDGD